MRLISRTVQLRGLRCPPSRQRAPPASFFLSSSPNKSSSFHQPRRLLSLDKNNSSSSSSPIITAITTTKAMTTKATNGAVPSPNKAEVGTLTTRMATPDDAAAIAALGTAVFTATFEASGCTLEQLRAYLDESYTEAAISSTLASASHATMVALASPEKGTELLGFVLLNRASSADEPCVVSGAYPRPVELQRLYVALDSHGRGVGRALMAAAEALARREAFETMWLGVWEDNARAQALYRSLGYERIGEHMFDVGGDLQRDLIMVKAL